MFGTLFYTMCRPHKGAHPVRAVARAESPDSRLVISEVYEFEKHTALDSAHDPIPSSDSMPLSYGVHESVASIPSSE